MRKRIVIGLLAVVVIGVVAFFVSQPKKGSVEWHKREYRDVMNQLSGRSVGQRFWRLRRQLTGESVYTDLPADISSRWEFHKQFLLDAGYLEQRAFRLTNAATFDPGVMYSAGQKMIPNERMRLSLFVPSIQRGTNVVNILGPREDMPIWEEVIRQADVPESGK